MSKLLFLGTCACDYSPKLKAEYKDCFDKDARRSSCALLNEKYLIDCGDHCLDSIRIANVDISKISDIFITHFHSDHFNLNAIKTIASGIRKPLNVWVRADAEVEPVENVEWHFMRVGEQYIVDADLKVTGYLANHDQSTHPQYLAFDVCDKKFLYALDGGWFINDTWNALMRSDLALLVIDCTSGNYEGDYRLGEHNSIPMIKLMLPSCKTVRLINENTKIYISHLAPSLHASHEETVKIMQKVGVNVAYDGLEIEF